MNDKVMVIIGLVILGVAVLYTIPKDASSIIHDIILSLGSIATGYSLGVSRERKRNT